MTIAKVMITATLLVLLTGNAEAAGSVERGEKLSYDCVTCHGMDGKGNFETPAIAGLDEAYILKRLRGFKSGELQSMDDMMLLYTEDKTDQDLQDLAAFWASKKE